MPQWLSIWTDQDRVVTPPDTARLDGALDIVVQLVCAGETVDHSSLPTDHVMQALVLRGLAAALMTAPSTEDCRTFRS